MSKSAWVAVTVLVLCLLVVFTLSDLTRWVTSARENTFHIGKITLVSTSYNATIEDITIKGSWSALDSLFFSNAVIKSGGY